jgi:NTE family protein
MDRINKTLSLIPKENKKNIEGLQHIDSLVLNPSHDFNAMACEHYNELSISVRLLLRSVGITNDPESSIGSYLLFEKNYCNRLIKLGFEDAMIKEAQIREFLSL